MKLLLLADKDVGLNSFKFISENFPQDIGLLVTVEKNEIYSYALDLGIDVIIFNEALIDDLKDQNFDLGITAWWPLILKPSFINIPNKGFINFHPSLLPYGRGKHYNFWTIVDKVPFGVSLHLVDEGIDSGPIIAQKKISYTWEDTGETLFFKAKNNILELFINEYPKLRGLNFSITEQNKSLGSFHLAQDIEEKCKISLNKSYVAKDLLNLIRARTFDNYPSCWFEDDQGDIFEVRIKISKRTP